MARPQRSKRVCNEPGFHTFSPNCVNGQRDSILLTVEEYETIRLIDLLHVSREECARRMNVARTTAQDIYNSARNKIAQCLVNGLELSIEGGSYWLCDGSAGCDDCRKRIAQRHDEMLQKGLDRKGEKTMRIAIAFEEERIFQQFGRSGIFKVYDVKDGMIDNCRLFSSRGIGHGELAELLSDNEVDVIICGGIGTGAEAVIKRLGIELVSGVHGAADEALRAYLDGELISSF